MSFLRRILRRPKPKKHIDVPDDKSTIPQKVAEDSARCLLSGDDRAAADAALIAAGIKRPSSRNS